MDLELTTQFCFARPRNGGVQIQEIRTLAKYLALDTEYATSLVERVEFRTPEFEMFEVDRLMLCLKTMMGRLQDLLLLKDHGLPDGCTYFASWELECGHFRKVV